MKKEKIILVLNGEIPKKNELTLILKKYDKIICADGAANKTIKANINPDFILGDLDSLQNDIINNNTTNIIELPDQNLNDFQKILIWLQSKDYKTIDIIGMDGKRIDHTISNFSIILEQISNFNLTIFTASGIFYTIETQKTFKNVYNKYFSIFSPNKDNRINSLGLKYELKDKTLNNIQAGALNFANQNEVRIKTEQTILIFISDEIKKN
jgi:thiamine pyrophosphokinase